jgi:alpha-L-arabinofuranosidase
MNKVLALLLCCLAVLTACKSVQETNIKIDLSKKGSEIPVSMYGVFFEEINHAGEGGLYAEMIRNRGFEDQVLVPGCKLENGFLIPPQQPGYVTGTNNHWNMQWDSASHRGWTVEIPTDAKATFEITDRFPLNSSGPHSMQIDLFELPSGNCARLVNDGFWGIAVKEGESYNLRFYVRVDPSYSGSLTAQIVSMDKTVLAQHEFVVEKRGSWVEYKGQLVAGKTDLKAHFVLEFNHTGKLWVDYVSLFPSKTFMNRPNGLRSDVAQMLANLKPAFIRWPGGCIVEGLCLENRVQWKETLGDPMQRPGVFDLWGYRNSYGFGYYEYLQFCEDIGSSAMYVCNVGLSCEYRSGTYCREEEVKKYLMDAQDAIEYALGDSTSTWGAKRAKAGHPAPFPLKYVEIGNENHGPIYDERFKQFYTSLKSAYPQVTFISNHGFNFNEIRDLGIKTDMVDPHFYVAPDWFFDNDSLFDKLKVRDEYKVYVGEYACNNGVGAGNMLAALSEAAFITGMERNSDLVKMCSYAPLLENSNDRNWPVNLIWLNNNQVIGRSSYYVQSMCAGNRPDVNLATSYKLAPKKTDGCRFAGGIGLGSWNTSVSFQDLVVTQQRKTKYYSKFVSKSTDWKSEKGVWEMKAGQYHQTNTDHPALSFAPETSFDTCTIELMARKDGGTEGFLILFGAKDAKSFYQLNIGGWSNTSLCLQQIGQGGDRVISSQIPFSVDTGKWYKIKLVVGSDWVTCFVNGKLILNYKLVEKQHRYVISGYDRKNGEIVVKVVNAEPDVFSPTISIENSGTISPIGNVISLSSPSEKEENSFEEPLRISPKESVYSGFSKKFNMEFQPWSFTILRIKASERR